VLNASQGISKFWKQSVGVMREISIQILASMNWQEPTLDNERLTSLKSTSLKKRSIILGKF
ncbi:Hypothetical protein FKW44_024594, partial [Caligus rogercresseyi]